MAGHTTKHIQYACECGKQFNGDFKKSLNLIKFHQKVCKISTGFEPSKKIPIVKIDNKSNSINFKTIGIATNKKVLSLINSH